MKTKRDILNEFDHEELFLLAGFPVEEGFVVNPLRNDNTPGCFYEWFNGTLYFADFTGFFGKSNVDAVDVLIEVTGYEVGELYNWIRFKKDNEYIPQVNIRETPPKKPIVINYEVRPWREHTYFSKYGIPTESLYKEGVHWLKWYSSNTRRLDRQIENIIGDPNVSPMIGYQFEDRVKIYNPYGSIKWFGNITSEDVWGFDTFDRNSDYCIITKSAKDFLVIKYVLGYECIAVQAEGIGLPNKVLKLLKDKNVFIIFDPDAAGIKASENLSRENGYSNIILPRIEDENGRFLTKDTSDLVLVGGVDYTRNIFKNFNIGDNKRVFKRAGIFG